MLVLIYVDIENNWIGVLEQNERPSQMEGEEEVAVGWRWRESTEDPEKEVK